MQAPAIRIMDWDFTYRAYIDTYTSLRFGRKLWEIGNFEVHMPADRQGASELQPGRLLYLDNDRAGLIETVEWAEGSGGFTVTASGTELKGILSRRIVVPGQRENEKYFGWDRFPDDGKTTAAETVMKHYVERHCIRPEDTKRTIERLELAADRRRGPLLNWQSRFDGLDEALAGIGEKAEMGFCIRADPEKTGYIFDIILPRERTASSGTPVIFSTSFGNLAESAYCDDLTALKNAVYAGGAGEDENRLIQVIYPEGSENVSGLIRRETFVDCGSADIDTLAADAEQKIKDMTHVTTLSGEILPTGPFAYRKDWDLGDRVTIQNRLMGLQSDMLITEVSESYEVGQTSVAVTFDKRKKNLIDLIRKKEAIR